MTRYEQGLTVEPSPESVELMREQLEGWGFSVTESSARSLVEAILDIEVSRIQAVTRGILHGSLETIRQTAEVALLSLKERQAEADDLVGALREHVSAGRKPSPRPTEPESIDDDEPRPVFKRRGR
jgi:hypothetical protein